MVIKTGREWLLVESSKLQDRRQWNCVIRNVTVESAELSDYNESTNVWHDRAVVAYTGIQIRWCSMAKTQLTVIVYTRYVVALEANEGRQW